MGEDPATIDVGDQHHRAVHRLGEAHVGDVLGAQVDLGGGAGTLDEDHLVLLGQAMEGVQHRHPGLGLVALVVAGVHGGDGATLDDDLGAGVRIGLEQHRIHVGVGLEAAGQGLGRLGAADLATVDGDGAVEGHVLGLEGGDPYPLTGQPAAQGRHQQALAGVGGSALDHEGAGRHGLTSAGGPTRPERACSSRAQSTSLPGRPRRRLAGS